MNGHGSGWIPGLSEDASAKWIGTNASAGSGAGSTALYAIPFRISGPFNSATLTLHYAADDTLAFLGSGGIFLNGTAVCTSLIQVGFGQEHTLICENVGSLLHIGINWLYFDDVNVIVSPAGLLFSATITTGSILSINPGGVVNAASAILGTVAPGSIASVYGSFPLNVALQAGGTPWPTNLSGLSVQFGGIPAPLYYAASTQAALQVPWEMAGQSRTNVTATINGQTSAPQSASLAPFSPAIFSTNGQGTGQGAILDSRYQVVDSSNPASVNDILQIYCTGKSIARASGL